MLLVRDCPCLFTAAPACPEPKVREVVERYFRADALGSADDLRSAFGNKAIPQSTVNTFRKLRLTSPDNGSPADLPQRLGASRWHGDL